MSEKKSNTSAQKSGGDGKLEKTVKIASAVLAVGAAVVQAIDSFSKKN